MNNKCTCSSFSSFSTGLKDTDVRMVWTASVLHRSTASHRLHCYHKIIEEESRTCDCGITDGRVVVLNPLVLTDPTEQTSRLNRPTLKKIFHLKKGAPSSCIMKNETYKHIYPTTCCCWNFEKVKILKKSMNYYNPRPYHSSVILHIKDASSLYIQNKRTIK